MGRPIKKGSTDKSTIIRILDSTTFLPEEAVEHDTAGIDLWYRREGATRTAITEAALASLDAAHSDGGIEHIDDGYYRLDLPDAAWAAASDGVAIGGTITGMIVIGNYHALVDYDPYDGVRMGMTALPNAAADAAGGLPISDAGGLDMDAILVDTGTTLDGKIDQVIAATITNASGVDIAADIIAVKAETAAIVADTNELQTDWVNGGRLDLILDIIAADTTTDIPALIDALPTAAEIKTAIEAAGGHLALILEDTGTTLPATLETIDNFLDTEIAAILADTNELQVDWVNGGRLDLLIDAIKTKTDALPGSVWDLASALTLDFGTLLERAYQLLNNKLLGTDATGAIALRNLADDADIATWSITDDDTTTTKTAATWA